MDLTYSPEDLEFRKKTRRWLEANVPRQELKTLDERKQWHRKSTTQATSGCTGPKNTADRDGGRCAATASDEMARANAPAPINGLGIGFIGPTIIIHGTDAQKQRY
jgi:alkylation response protein AidB-like acyl-CoA dehydrogenase